MRALGPDALMNPWNPWVTVLPLVTLLLLAWSIAERDWIAIPWAVFVGSFLVQSHVSYVPVTAAALVVAAALAWLVRRSGWAPAPHASTSRRSLRGTLVAGGIVGVVVWIPPLIDLVFGSHNLWDLVRSFGTQTGGAGLGHAAGLLSTQAAPWGPWLTGQEPLDAFSGTVAASSTLLLLVPAVALTSAIVVAVIRRDRAAASLATLATIDVVVAVEAISRIQGAIFAYLIQFAWAVVAIAWLAVLRSWGPVLAELAERVVPGASARRAVVGVAAIGVTAAVVVSLVTMPSGLSGGQPPDTDQESQMAGVDTAVIPAVVARAADGAPVLVRSLDPDTQFPAPSPNGLALGLVPALEQHGIDVKVPEVWLPDDPADGRLLFGAARLDDGGPISGTILVLGGDQIVGYQPPAGAEQLYLLGDPAARQAAQQDRTALHATLLAAGQPDAAADVLTDQLEWIPFHHPELSAYGDRIQHIVDVLAAPLVAVYWVPGRADGAG
jgi:hypothetical protein